MSWLFTATPAGTSEPTHGYDDDYYYYYGGEGEGNSSYGDEGDEYSDDSLSSETEKILKRFDRESELAAKTDIYARDDESQQRPCRERKGKHGVSSSRRSKRRRREKAKKAMDEEWAMLTQAADGYSMGTNDLVAEVGVEVVQASEIPSLVDLCCAVLATHPPPPDTPFPPDLHGPMFDMQLQSAVREATLGYLLDDLVEDYNTWGSWERPQYVVYEDMPFAHTAHHLGLTDLVDVLEENVDNVFLEALSQRLERLKPEELALAVAGAHYRRGELRRAQNILLDAINNFSEDYGQGVKSMALTMLYTELAWMHVRQGDGHAAARVFEVAAEAVAEAAGAGDVVKPGNLQANAVIALANRHAYEQALYHAKKAAAVPNFGCVGLAAMCYIKQDRVLECEGITLVDADFGAGREDLGTAYSNNVCAGLLCAREMVEPPYAYWNTLIDLPRRGRHIPVLRMAWTASLATHPVASELASPYTLPDCASLNVVGRELHVIGCGGFAQYWNVPVAVRLDTRTGREIPYSVRAVPVFDARTQRHTNFVEVPKVYGFTAAPRAMTIASDSGSRVALVHAVNRVAQVYRHDWQTVDKLDLRKLLMSHLRKNVEEIALECGQYGVPWKTDAERELAVEIGHYLVNRGYVPQVSAMYIRYKRAKDAAVKAATEAESKRNKYGGGGKSKRRRGTKQKKGKKSGKRGSDDEQKGTSVSVKQKQTQKVSQKPKVKVKLELSASEKRRVCASDYFVVAYSTLPGAVVFMLDSERPSPRRWNYSSHGVGVVVVRTDSADAFRRPTVHFFPTSGSLSVLFSDYQGQHVASPHRRACLFNWHSGSEACCYVVDPTAPGLRGIPDLAGDVSYDNYIFGTTVDPNTHFERVVRYNLDDDTYLTTHIRVRNDAGSTGSNPACVAACGDQLLVTSEFDRVVRIVDDDLNTLVTLPLEEDVINDPVLPGVLATYLYNDAIHHVISHGHHCTVWSPDVEANDGVVFTFDFRGTAASAFVVADNLFGGSDACVGPCQVLDDLSVLVGGRVVGCVLVRGECDGVELQFGVELRVRYGYWASGVRDPSWQPRERDSVGIVKD